MSAGTARLGDVATFVRGITFKPADVLDEITADAVGCMRTKNVQTQLDEKDVWFLPKNFVANKNQVLQEGDLLVSTANSWNLVGKACWVPKLNYVCTFGGFISALRATESVVDRRYLYYWFTSTKIQTKLRSFGNKTTNISNLSIKRANDLVIPLPPLAEQKRIAAILDKAAEIKSNREQAIAKLDCLVQSTFVEMFGDPVANSKGWKQEKLEGLVSGRFGVKAGPFGSALKKEEYVESGYKIYGQEQVIAGSMTIGDYFIPPEKYRQLSTCAIEEGDVLVSLVGSFGKVLVVPPIFEAGIINPRLLKISPNKSKLLPNYLCEFLQNTQVQLKLKANAHGGIMGILNVGLLKELVVIVPPIALQKEFVELREKIELKKQQLIDSQVACNKLLNSLQHQAFTTGFAA